MVVKLTYIFVELTERIIKMSAVTLNVRLTNFLGLNPGSFHILTEQTLFNGFFLLSADKSTEQIATLSMGHFF
jgi:hypothetical protein